MNPTIVELLDQILNGDDIPPPESMLKISTERANVQPAHAPYSIAGNLWHLVYWQDIWLFKLGGGTKSVGMKVWTEDWQTPEPGDWPELRRRALEGLRQARSYATGEATHGMPSDADATSTLLNIAIHAAYHLGQINLLKRSLKLEAE